jgi:hypothetical protein
MITNPKTLWQLKKIKEPVQKILGVLGRNGIMVNRIIFLILLFSLAILYNYPEIAFKRPQSVHNWRQSDCASLTLNYYQNGMKFFKPEVHALISDNLSTGNAATSEIPLLYYGVAGLYKIFGYHDYIYRIINTFIFLFGLYSLFLLFTKLQVDPFWSISLSLLFFASPVLAYYGNNFITDITAFSFTLAGWNNFISYYKKNRNRYFVYAMIFFFLGMSMKISAGISLLTILGIFFLDYTGIVKFRAKGKLFPYVVVQLIPFVLILLVVGSWALFARSYNLLHDCFYFSTQTYPLWNISAKDLQLTLENIKILWLDQYFHRYTLILFLIVFIVNLIHLKKADKLLMVSNLIVFTGCILYAILWFDTFRNHDYYTINLYILLVMNLIVFAEYMNRLYPKITSLFDIRLMLAIILLFNVIHTKNQMYQRYYGWWNERTKFKDFETITPYLRSIGITRYDKVISLSDQSHHTLYLMNQPGWTECYSLNRDSASVQQSIDRGAKYLLIASCEDLDSRPYMRSFIHDPCGRYGSVLIFRLGKNNKKNPQTGLPK